VFSGTFARVAKELVVALEKELTIIKILYVDPVLPLRLQTRIKKSLS